jgi:hypothetical protein
MPKAVMASEAKQSSFLAKDEGNLIASSQELLAMTGIDKELSYRELN